MQQLIDSENLKCARLLALLALALLPLSRSAFAQGAGNDYQIGMPQHADFSGSSFENVQMNNNNLHIDLPLWSTSGRGPSVGMRYVYDSKGWGFNGHCNHITGLCTDFVSPGRPGSPPTHLKLSLVGPGYLITFTNGTFTCNGTGVNVVTKSYTVNAPDGTSYHFVPDPIEYNGESAYCLPHPTTLYTDDGSGWVLSLDPGGAAIKAVAKDGTVVSGSTVGTFEDANGNQVISSSTPATDTLGRTIPTGGSYYDSSGVLRTIPVVNQSVAIQTNLCWNSGADYCYEYSGNWNVPQIITLPNGKTYTFS